MARRWWRTIRFATSSTGRGYVAGGSANALSFDANTLAARSSRVRVPSRSTAVAVQRDGSEVYVAGSNEDGTDHQVAMIDIDDRLIVNLDTVRFPEGMALSSDGDLLYVSSLTDNVVGRIDTRRRRRSGSVPVGGAPMGIAVAAVPTICDGDCNGDDAVGVDELIRAATVAVAQQVVGVCSAADHDDDLRVTVDEVVRAANSAVLGCL